ncbi:hypothetical protein [Kineobactrum salinum]|uniref:Uncharacterized protein n=1 Tax=Kineobactrum salinum TaxID=2708301 RepID=A0A6C0U7S9_9GAMM|nr:hypothetical protein [Kineobactrum salinum]QIB67047.1 hypothetical protein G3T16_18265 [Kineobactrum salinum]
MKTVAGIANIGTLVLTAVLSTSAFAGEPAQADSRLTLAMNDAPVVRHGGPSMTQGTDAMHASNVEVKMADTMDEIAEQLNRELEARMTAKLERAI